MIEDKVITISWTKGWFSYRIERNYLSGYRETICKVSRSLPDAEILVLTMCTALLEDNLTVKP
jgi:hypothetical protein